jgi:hypothetical protein
MGSALSRILQPFRQMSVNEAFGREDDFSVLYSCFQNVTNLDVHLFTDMLRNHNLKLVFYGDEIHIVPVLQFNCLTVQLSGPSSKRQPSRHKRIFKEKASGLSLMALQISWELGSGWGFPRLIRGRERARGRNPHGPTSKPANFVKLI